jgi:hypothetical protein
MELELLTWIMGIMSALVVPVLTTGYGVMRNTISPAMVRFWSFYMFIIFVRLALISLGIRLFITHHCYIPVHLHKLLGRDATAIQVVTQGTL